MASAAAATTKGNKYLPEELISEILIRLPVKSLLRFRAVSHPWLSLISSPSFIYSHLLHSSKIDRRCILTVLEEDEDRDEDSISLIHLNSDLEFPDVVDLEFPGGEFAFEFLTIIGSCNGIVCTELKHGPYRDMYLWNPATKQFKLIPPHTLNINLANADFSCVCGFGFDSISNDFKVVRAVNIKRVGEPNEYTAEVYSANNNVWTVVHPRPKSFPSGFLFDVCMKGVLCYVGYDSLMTFDLNKEVFYCGIKLPIVRNYYIHKVVEFNGSLALIDYSDDSNCKITFWKLDDACLLGGTEGSWTPILSFDVSFRVYFVRCYLDSGDLVLYDDADYPWFLYNLDKKEDETVRIPYQRGNIFKYVESLVSITGFKQVGWNDRADDN